MEESGPAYAHAVEANGPQLVAQLDAELAALGPVRLRVARAAWRARLRSEWSAPPSRGPPGPYLRQGESCP